MHFEGKIEAPTTPALAPGASIGKNMVFTDLGIMTHPKILFYFI